MKKQKTRVWALSLVFFLATGWSAAFAQVDILSKEERLWLRSRNNTIVVYPEKNAPPFVYVTNPNSPPAGLSIDYLELIAEQIGAKIVYLPARSRAQIRNDILEGRGDVIARVDSANAEQEELIVTQPYISVPAVIVVRRDSGKKDVELSELSGKQVAVTSNSGAAYFIRENYPRVVLSQVTDDEIALQQLALGDVDAAILDVASLSYFLSRQALSAVRIAGSTGFYYQLSFGMTSDKTILQSILEKGYSQVATVDRNTVTEKWINIDPEQTKLGVRWFGEGETGLIIGAIILGALIIAVTLYVLLRQRYRALFRIGRNDSKKEVAEKIEKLEHASEILEAELKEIKELEHKLIESRHDSETKNP